MSPFNLKYVVSMSYFKWKIISWTIYIVNKLHTRELQSVNIPQMMTTSVGTFSQTPIARIRPCYIRIVSSAPAYYVVSPHYNRRTILNKSAVAWTIIFDNIIPRWFHSAFPIVFHSMASGGNSYHTQVKVTRLGLTTVINWVSSGYVFIRPG